MKGQTKGGFFLTLGSAVADLSLFIYEPLFCELQSEFKIQSILKYLFITLWRNTFPRQMLFHIEATETVQLRPCDFHEHYATAVIALMKEQLLMGCLTFGKVLQVIIRRLDPKTPLLQPHTGVATFQVAYKAIIERPMRNERAVAYVESIERSNDNFFILKLLLGSYILETTLLDKLYRETSIAGAGRRKLQPEGRQRLSS